MPPSTPSPAAWLLILACLNLAACARDPEVTAMVPEPPESLPTGSDKTVAIIRAQGGEDTNLFIEPSLGDAGFRKALHLALEGAGLFRAALVDQNADYLLYPEVITQELIPGLKMTAVLHARYRLIEAWSQKKLWEDRILTVYDADLGEGLYGLTRARAALEGAVRKNLKKLVKRLAKRVEALSDRRE
ncbi:MAG: hypothetical protein M3461_09155 [Pseudomonadota bacterium]|nr:hypothetical protein [Pseudomonadota bacterium]